MGNDRGLNAHVLASATGDVPFCGAVSFLHIPRLAEALKGGNVFPPLCSIKRSASLVALMERLASSVECVYSVSTVAEGTRTARALVVPTKE